MGLLRITKEDILDRITKTETTDKISAASALVIYNKQAVMSKSMVLDRGWFNGNRMKFEN